MSEETFTKAQMDAAVDAAVQSLKGEVDGLKEQLATDAAKREKGTDDAVKSLRELYDKRVSGLESDYGKAKSGLEDQNKLLLEQIKQRDQELLGTRHGQVVDKLVSELGGDSPALLKSYLQNRVKVERNDKGQIEASFVSKDGKVVTADVLQKELYADEEIKHRLKPTGSTGAETDTPAMAHGQGSTPYYQPQGSPYPPMMNQYHGAAQHGQHGQSIMQRADNREIENAEFSKRVQERYRRGEHLPARNSAGYLPNMSGVQDGAIS